MENGMPREFKIASANTDVSISRYGGLYVGGHDVIKLAQRAFGVEGDNWVKEFRAKVYISIIPLRESIEIIGVLLEEGKEETTEVQEEPADG